MKHLLLALCAFLLFASIHDAEAGRFGRRGRGISPREYVPSRGIYPPHGGPYYQITPGYGIPYTLQRNAQPYYQQYLHEMGQWRYGGMDYGGDAHG